MSDSIDIAVVGAGPYGLSLASHLRAARLDHRIFGRPMDLWRARMPAGMFLKSQGFASNLSDPSRTHTLEEFCRRSGRGYGSYGVPIPLDTFVAYGDWFQRSQAPDLEETMVGHVGRAGRRFELTLADGRSLTASAVVVAAGVEHFANRPDWVPALGDAASHSADHTDLSAFAGQDVTVIGHGQAALESAALLLEAGASVRVVMRAPAPAWNGQPLPPERPLVRRLREPESGLGSGWATWFYSTQQSLYARLPQSVRVSKARTALGPAGASWLRPRVEGRIPMLSGCRVVAAVRRGGGVELTLRHGDGATTTIRTDHVLAATGFRSDVRRLAMLDGTLRERIATVSGAPKVGLDFQSSVPGLYFVGPSVASTFGPSMRFVHGADYAVRKLSAALGARGARSAPAGSPRAGARGAGETVR